MHKVDKYCKRFTKDVIISDRSRYYKFGSQILRISDHIGSNSSGNYSIIISNNGYILHNHESGLVKIISYNDIKALIKGISLCADLISNKSLQVWELSKNETINVNKETTSNDISRLINKTKSLYALLNTNQRRSIKKHLTSPFSNIDSDFLKMAKTPIICEIFKTILGVQPNEI